MYRSRQQKKNRDRTSTKLYKVLIKYNSYQKVQPVEKIYQTRMGPRKYWRLQMGWTDLFLDTFWEQHKLPSTFVIKKHHISHSNRGDFVTFSGNCADCKSAFFGDIEDEPIPENYVIINFIAPDTKNIEHAENKKRMLRYPKRQIIGENVQHIGATQWQGNFADEWMEYGDNQPPTLYNKDVLRKCKQDVVDGDLGTYGSDPILSLIDLKHSSEHYGNIHTISSDKFFAHYWLATQSHIYKVLRRQKWVTMSIDATGSLILPIERTSNKISSGHIFLYQMVTTHETQTIPIAQQLSEKHDTLSIYYWLANWVSSGMKPLDECISDYSKALLRL